MNKTCLTEFFNPAPPVPKSFVTTLFNWGGWPAVIGFYTILFVVLVIGSYYLLKSRKEEREKKL